jgi:hypothetical protein
MNYTLKALFLAFVMFLALDMINKSRNEPSLKTTVKSYLDKNARKDIEPTYKAFAELTCGDICRGAR